MGKFGSPQIGVFSPDGNDYDDPNLNKCINCGALFQGDFCPICKTACVPEMRAGKRKTDKKKNPNKESKKPSGCIGCFLIIVMLLAALLARIAWDNFSVGDANDTENQDGKSTEYVTQEIDKNEYYAIYGYETLARYPDEYKGTKVCLAGAVLQTIDAGKGWMNMRLKTNQNNNHVVYCVYHEKMIHGRLLEDDEIVIYGRADGLYTYTAVSGTQITIPLIRVDAIEFAE